MNANSVIIDFLLFSPHQLVEKRGLLYGKKCHRGAL